MEYELVEYRDEFMRLMHPAYMRRMPRAYLGFLGKRSRGSTMADQVVITFCVSPDDADVILREMQADLMAVDFGPLLRAGVTDTVIRQGSSSIRHDSIERIVETVTPVVTTHRWDILMQQPAPGVYVSIGAMGEFAPCEQMWTEVLRSIEVYKRPPHG